MRAARMDTRDLEERLRRMAREHDATRAAIEAELRREHFGRVPDGWHATADGTVNSKP